MFLVYVKNAYFACKFYIFCCVQYINADNMNSNIIVKDVKLSLTISFQLGNIIVQFIKTIYQS